MKIEDPAVIVAEFEGLVNMAARELEAWLESEASRCPAWAGDELIALENGRIVLDILRRNPARNWELYTKGDVEHMRRVVCYCTRQYDLPNNGTNRDRNLKNWGHDVNKALQQVDRLGVESAE
ncbi:hypothetical protein QBC44DRAFT_402817 [Cladorrhinum sp. PSN332]|nr:hypothetical protein QBC44DRAFT_402817 [Cladorrhinum sp. PSN332]